LDAFKGVSDQWSTTMWVLGNKHTIADKIWFRTTTTHAHFFSFCLLGKLASIALNVWRHVFYGIFVYMPKLRDPGRTDFIILFN